MFGYPRLKLRRKRGTQQYYVMLVRAPLWSQKAMRFLTREDAQQWLRKHGNAWLADYRSGRMRKAPVSKPAPAE